jgi:hypothetical protein
MSFHDKRKNIRINDEVEKKAEELRKKFQIDYPTISHIYRAGVLALWQKRIGGK